MRAASTASASSSSASLTRRSRFTQARAVAAAPTGARPRSAPRARAASPRRWAGRRAAPPRGRPVLAETRRDGRGGLAGHVPDAVVRDHRRHRVQRPQRAAALQLPDRRRRARGRRREQRRRGGRRLAPNRRANAASAASERSSSAALISAPSRAIPRVRRSRRSRMRHAARVVVDAAQIARHERRERADPVVRIALGDLVPERAQQLDGSLASAARRRSSSLRERARRNARREGDAQPPGRRRRGLRERDSRHRRAIEIDPLAPEATSWNSAVSATLRAEHAVDRQAVPRARARRQRDAPALRLQPEQPAPRRRDADRAGAVGAERGADEARRDGRRAAAARAARRALQVPRIARDAERRRLGERPDAQLWDVRLADDHRAGRAQAAHDLGVRREPGRSTAFVPSIVGSPATSMSSLTANGTPSNDAAAARRRRCAALLRGAHRLDRLRAAHARRDTTLNAFSVGCVRSIRRR